MFTLPDLPYAYNGLEPFIDEATMRIHHTKHHATYINKLNEALKDHPDLLDKKIDDLLKSFNSLPDALKTAVKNHGGGHANHSMFWTIMAPVSGQKEPEGKLADKIKQKFGDFAGFKDTLTKAATNRFGSGWAWLVVSNGTLEVVDTPNQDSPVIEAVPAIRQGKNPLLGIDVWEHAYYLKYQNRRPDYIEAWWNVINWKEVEKRFDQLK